MNKYNQIKWLEKLAEDILEQYTAGYSEVDKEVLAEAMYNAGCRKQSEYTVEVVRCKDCKHATFYSCKNDTCYQGIICEYRQGMLRVRYYDDYTKMWFSEDIINVKFCPACGRRLQ